MRALLKPAARYLVPAATPDLPHRSELGIKKSLFITQSCHCSNCAEARSFIARVKAANPDASHNCWAFTALPPGRVGQQGSSDDGEPHGTAGRPMLQCLLGSGVGEICMVVSRWFGGIKLGTGGLVKAYQQAALENLATLPKVERIPFGRWLVNLDYESLDAVKRYFQENGIKTENERYGARVSLEAAVPLDAPADFASALAAITAGRAEILPLDLPAS